MGTVPESRDGAWLERHAAHLPAAGLALDLGCGPGLESSWLLARGLTVVALDRSVPALVAARRTAQGAMFVRADLAEQLPFRPNSFGLVVASLSLHYLPWNETLAAFAEVRRVLGPGAPFVFRVNATDDYHHGAGKGIEEEPNFYQASVPGHATHKRFFDEAAVRAALDIRFRLESLEHRTIHRYENPKRIWECLALAD